MGNPVGEATVLVAVGSIDGIAGAAACIRHAKNSEIECVFTQAADVGKIVVSQWKPNRKVGFIDLGVNNEGRGANQQITIDFVKKIKEAGHEILFIADEHGKASWFDVLTQCDIDVSNLTIRPEDRADFGSSCAILENAIGASADSHTKELLEAGHQADQRNFKTKFGTIFNRATKSNMADDERRKHLAKYMAFHEEPDAKIGVWMAEYAGIEKNTQAVFAKGEVIDGVGLYDTSEAAIDTTELFEAGYSKNKLVVIRNAKGFFDGKMQSVVSIGTSQKELNLLEAIKKAGIAASGIPTRVNCALKDEEAATRAVRSLLQ